jgi:hypothetical protein
MTTDNFCFYLQNRLIQTSQTGGQQYSDPSPFSIPWWETPRKFQVLLAPPPPFGQSIVLPDSLCLRHLIK